MARTSLATLASSMAPFRLHLPRSSCANPTAPNRPKSGLSACSCIPFSLAKCLLPTLVQPSPAGLHNRKFPCHPSVCTCSPVCSSDTPIDDQPSTRSRCTLGSVSRNASYIYLGHYYYYSYHIVFFFPALIKFQPKHLHDYHHNDVRIIPDLF